MRGLDKTLRVEGSRKRKTASDDSHGVIFDIQGYSIDDGPGIRKLVFLKGCNLRCAWCSNPESQKFSAEVEFFPQKCIRCGLCLEVCPQDAINSTLALGEEFKIDRRLCDDCGQCALRCPTGALRIVGYEASVGEVVEEIEKDRSYYRESGGVTLSGGEPLAQPRFALDILKRCFELNIHTAIETAGYVPWVVLKAVLPFTDLIIFDVKHWDEKIHRQMTGMSNREILRNLNRLSRTGKEILVRIPLIPGFNADPETLTQIAKIVKDEDLKNVSFLPFHQLGKIKYRRLSLEYSYENFPNLLSVRESRELIEAKRIFAGFGFIIQE